MEYFRWLSLILGCLMTLGGVWLLAGTGSYRKVARGFLSEKRPGWYVWSAAVMLGLIGYTWVRFLEVRTAAALGLAFILSLTLIKAYFFTCRYQEFRAFAERFVGLEGPVLKTIGLIYLALAAALLALGLSI